MGGLVQACGILVGALLCVLFFAMIWSSASQLWHGWRNHQDGGA